MPNLLKENRKILKELQKELQSDIKMLNNYCNKIEKLLQKNKIDSSDLGDDIETAIQRKKNPKFALVSDIANLETEYNIKINYKMET